MDIWATAQGEHEIKPIMATIFRLVESQQQAATLSLVNTVHEQGVLEELLEMTKNPLPEQSDSYHYLLSTPFRYPPLQYGSRFGTAQEPSLFYGSLTLPTALAETAYYRFVYMQGPAIPFKKTISSEYTAFSVRVKSEYGIFLDEPPFSDYEAILSSPCSYQETQYLGRMMRRGGVELFRYLSARDKNRGKNIALFTPKAFYTRKPLQSIPWLCQTSSGEVGFLSTTSNERILFLQKDFWVENAFPLPAL